MKYILSKIKAILKAIFINWWWGFWRRKPKEMSDEEILAQEDEWARETHELTKDFWEENLTTTVAPAPMSEQWNKRRVVILSLNDHKAEAIKIVMAISGLGLKGAKRFIDSHEEHNYLLLGPFKELSPNAVADDFMIKGVIALVVVMDNDGDFEADADTEDEDIDLLWEEVSECMYVKPVTDGLEPIYLPIELANYEDDENLDWLDEVDEEPDDDNQPDDIEFGHEDTELEPNRY